MVSIAHMMMLQVRNMPDEMHRLLKARAAMAGVSMSDYVLRELQRALERPERAELLRRLGEQPRTLTSSPTDLIREERDARARA